MEYLQSAVGILVDDILICWTGIGTNHKQILWLLVLLICVVLRTKKKICNVDTQGNLQKAIIFLNFA